MCAANNPQGQEGQAVDDYAVAEILIEDGGLADRWKIFARNLKIRTTILNQCERKYRAQEPIEEIFLVILEGWVNVAAGDANPINLSKELRRLESRRIAEEIERLFGLSYIPPDGYSYIAEAAAPQPRLNWQLEHEIEIQAGAQNFPYEAVFGNYLGDEIKQVILEDTYIRSKYQVENLKRFLDLVVSRCRNLENITVVTQHKNGLPSKEFQDFETEWRSQNAGPLVVRHNPDLHDRVLKLDDQWKIRMGRGLDYFQHYDEGTRERNNPEQRKCKECTITALKKV